MHQLGLQQLVPLNCDTSNPLFDINIRGKIRKNIGNYIDSVTWKFQGKNLNPLTPWTNLKDFRKGLNLLHIRYFIPYYTHTKSTKFRTSLELENLTNFSCFLGI